jgi:uncharacterized protein YabN with tetrapyrrole methylase and pyrophosphatase domain
MLEDRTERGIYIVGHGIKGVSHLTLETNKLLLQMDFVFYMDAGTELGEYLSVIDLPSMNLIDWYAENRDREEIYGKIAAAVVAKAEKADRVAYLAPGNPFFLNSICELLFLSAAGKGIAVQLLSGVSSIDTLISDLQISVGEFGLQCYDATSFGLLRPKVDIFVPLMLFDPGVFYDPTVRFRSNPDSLRVAHLRDCLLEYYPGDEMWILVHSPMTRDEKLGYCVGTLAELHRYAEVIGRGTLFLPGRWRFTPRFKALTDALRGGSEAR